MKKIFTILAVVCVAFAFTSCGVESKVKGFMQEKKELDIKRAELEIEYAELGAEVAEYLSELDKADMKEYLKNERKWQKEIDKEYRDELKDLENEREKINKDAADFMEKFAKKSSKIEIDYDELEDLAEELEDWE